MENKINIKNNNKTVIILGATYVYHFFQIIKYTDKTFKIQWNI